MHSLQNNSPLFPYGLKLLLRLSFASSITAAPTGRAAAQSPDRSRNFPLHGSPHFMVRAKASLRRSASTTRNPNRTDAAARENTERTHMRTSIHNRAVAIGSAFRRSSDHLIERLKPAKPRIFGTSRNLHKFRLAGTDLPNSPIDLPDTIAASCET